MAPTVEQTAKPKDTAQRSAPASLPLTGQQTEVRRALTGLPIVAPGEYRVAPSPDGGVAIYFNPLDVQGWTSPLAEAFARYVSQVFPGATRAEAEACAKANGVTWIHEIPKNVTHLPSVPVTFLGPLHANVKSWFKDHRPDIHPVEPAGRLLSLDGREGSREAIPTFDPQGALVIAPEEAAYVLGSTVRIKLEFTGEAVRRAFNYNSASAFFDWSVTDATGKEVLSGPLLEGWGARDVEIGLDKAKLFAGQRYTLRVAVTSRWFRRSPFRPEPVSFLTATEEQRNRDVFEALLGEQGAPFERVNGQLQLKQGARPATIEDEMDQASYWLGWIAGLEKKHSITADQAEEYRAVFTQRKAHLAEKRKLVSGSLPYYAFGTLIDATSSAHTKLSLAVYGQQEQEGETFRHTFRAVDSTLSPNDPPVYTGTGEGESPAVAERAALADLLADWRSHNDYPDGTVHLGIRLRDGSVREETMNTRHAKKVVKRNAGRVAMGLGAVGLGISVYTGGTTAPPALAALETGVGLAATGATLLDVGLRLEERLSTQTQRADSQALLDALAVASLGVGKWAQMARAAKPAAGGKFVLPIFGLDASQMAVMGVQTHAQIQEIDLRYEQQMAGASEEKKGELARERDAEIKGLMTEAIVNGGIAVVPVAKGAVELVDLGIAHAAAAPHIEPAPHVEATPHTEPAPHLETEPLRVAPAPERSAPPKVQEPPRVQEPLSLESLKIEPLKLEDLPAPRPVASFTMMHESFRQAEIKPGELRYHFETFLRREIENPASETRRAQATEHSERMLALDNRYKDTFKVEKELLEAKREALNPPEGETPEPFDEAAHQEALARNEAERQRVVAESTPLMEPMRQHASQLLAQDLGGTPAQHRALLERMTPPEVRGLAQELGRERLVKLLDAGSPAVERFLNARRLSRLNSAGRARLLQILELHRAGTLDDAGLVAALDESIAFLTLYPNGLRGDFRRMAADFDPTAPVTPVEKLSTAELYQRMHAGEKEAAEEMELRRQSLSSEALQKAAQQAEKSAKQAWKSRLKDDARRAREEKTRLRDLLSQRNLLLEKTGVEQGPYVSRPEMRVLLEEAIQKHRTVPRIDTPMSDADVEGGTLGAASASHLPQSEPFLGRSPAAHAEGEESTINPRYKSPSRTTAAHGHAEQTLAGDIANATDELIAAGKLTQADLAGHTVWMLIDQEVCSYCAAGLESPVAPGVLAQFSQDYPLLTIQIKNLRTSDLMILRGGRRINSQ
ncbi:MAG TPA: hypothetical protein VF173_23750 [Thermoanaerobaculia bacterium]|nr:hypothetical protein [Thermoanaerobaculia bacterium]